MNYDLGVFVDWLKKNKETAFLDVNDKEKTVSWLEELKRRREYDGEIVGGGALNNAYQQGYSKAENDYFENTQIDRESSYKIGYEVGYHKATNDFVERFIYKAVCEGCSGCCNRHEESRQSECEDYKAYIEIAEQLKEGGTDE